MADLAHDGLPKPGIIVTGNEIRSDATILRHGNSTVGYFCKCSRCHRQWGPHWAHCVGFVVAAARRHAANCGLPPLDSPEWRAIWEAHSERKDDHG